jgi:DNA polymerase III subunit delta
MEIRADQLPKHLNGTLKFSYLLAGDEPLLIMEAADQIRAAARAQGFNERCIFDVNNQLDWDDVRYQAQAMGLFAQQKIIELRLNSGKLDADGVKLLEAWAENPPEGIVLLVVCPEWKKDFERAAWVRAINQHGAQIVFWPLKREELPAWLVKRAQNAGLRLHQDAALALADRVEGNLLAAKQELDALSLISAQRELTGQASNKQIELKDIEDDVSDGARFNAASVADAALLGDAERVVRVLRSLQAEGEEAFMILSVLIRQIELTYELSIAQDEGGKSAVARLYPMRGVWPARQKFYERALARSNTHHWAKRLAESAETDQTVKGRRYGDAWLSIERLALRVALPGHQAARFE